MKKIRLSALIMAFCMMISLCACGEGDMSDAGTVSAADVSGSDVSTTDVSSTDAEGSWYDELDEEERVLADVVLSGTDAFNAKNEDAYMAVIDPESEAREETLEYIRLIFKKYSLTASVEKIEVGRIRNGAAEVRVTQTTVRNGEGKSFADVRTVLLHTMVQRGEEWYITSTVVESRTELDTDWDIAGDYLADQQVSESDLQTQE